MIHTLVQAGTLLTLIALGALVRRLGLLKNEDFKVLCTVALNVTIPAAIFWGTRSLELSLPNLAIMALGLGLNVLFLLTVHLLTPRRAPVERAFSAFNLPGYNIGCFALPFVQSLLPASAIATACLFDSGNAMMSCGLTYALGAGYLGVKRKGNPLLNFGKRMLSSTPFCVYLIIFFLRGFHLQLPSFFWTLVQSIAPANTFLCMFMLGVGLNFSLEREKRADLWWHTKWRWGLAGLSLILGWLFLPFEKLPKMAVLLMMASPPTIIATAFTARVGGDSQLASTYNALNTLISLAVMTALVMALGGQA